MAKSQDKKKPRKIEHLESAKVRHYIFCEGEQTEPNYFLGFKESIASNPIYNHLVHVHIEGVGAETLRVIYEAEEFVRDNRLKSAVIWCVYDKDSFPSQDFNAVSERAEVLNRQQNDVEYRVAWSNECIEYWFVLHFDYYTSNNNRKYYRSYLHSKFRELGWSRYKKNSTELFKIMTEYGNPKRAIAWAKQRMEDCNGLTDAECAPATKVFLLVEELAKYLPDQIKAKYI